MTLTANNSGWTGPLNIIRGDVSAAVPNALNAANSVTFSPAAGNVAALYLFGQNITVGSLSGTAAGSMWIRNGSLISGGYADQPRSDAVLTVDQTVNGTFAGVMSDGPNEYYGGSSPNFSLGLVKAGPATLVLSGTDTYSGGTTVEAGTLLVTTADAVPTNGAWRSGPAGPSSSIRQTRHRRWRHRLPRQLLLRRRWRQCLSPRSLPCSRPEFLPLGRSPAADAAVGNQRPDDP